MKGIKHNTRLQHWLAGLGILAGTVLLLILLAVAAYAATNIWPNLGAGTVDIARSLLGDQFVSGVENFVLSSEDSLKQAQYRLLKTTPAAPWQAASGVLGTPAAGGTPLATPNPSVMANNPALPTPSEAGWRLENVPALGGSPGEGAWTPYLWDGAGNVVAYRTFLQPDPQRPYASVAVVAFDLQATRLHFVLGYEEPVSSVYISRPARIPANDMQPGKILAAFNGGFKAQHGHFGVMMDGVTLIPPRNGFGTLALYDDGKAALGAWGEDITPSPHMVAYRQNGPLIIQAGQINPHTAINDPQVWGYTTYGGTATGRSALGIGPDGTVLYYAVGFDLTISSLARAVQDAGAFQAIQLDINNFYTHFEAFTVGTNNKLTAVPLLDQMKGPGDQRYLTINKRDFFYVTTK
ncbi:MAG: phosphodiester glycosidase family protein [Anaerolineales bacterium]